MNLNSVDQLVKEAAEIEALEAKEAGALGYMARVLVQATLPHSKVKGNEFVRTNGRFTLSLMAPSKIGLPYGSIPRILIAWIGTEAVKTQSRNLTLGNNLSMFMSNLDLIPTGGRWGTITRLRDQMKRLFSCTISAFDETNKSTEDTERGFRLTDERYLWWEPTNPDQNVLFEPYVILSEKFYEQIIEFPVPIDLRVLKALTRSPLALDIYCWLTYRYSYLKKTTVISWPLLEAQFGSDYTLTRSFKANFLDQLKKVSLLYPDANITVLDKGLELRPSSTHIAKIPG